MAMNRKWKRTTNNDLLDWVTWSKQEGLGHKRERIQLAKNRKDSVKVPTGKRSLGRAWRIWL